MSRLLRVTQVRSAIDRSADQKRTIRALGIRRLHNPVLHRDTPQIRGMLVKVRHLVQVEEVEEAGRDETLAGPGGPAPAGTTEGEGDEAR